jgi:hypothetical protein
VFIELTPRQGGRGRTTLFRLDANALPVREPFYSKGGTRHPGISQPKAEADFRVSAGLADENPEVGETEPGSAEGETRKSVDELDEMMALIPPRANLVSHATMFPRSELSRENRSQQPCFLLRLHADTDRETKFLDLLVHPIHHPTHTGSRRCCVAAGRRR